MDVEGKCVTQLSAPRIALIRAEMDREGVTLSAPEMDSAQCPFVSGLEVRSAEVLMESLAELNARLRSPVLMNRFRPNLAISGSSPHEDDGWKRIRIGEVVLQIRRACDHRCGVPNIEQETSVSTVEPLRTLATYRRSSKGIYFGQNVTVEAGGEFRVGDPVDVLEFGVGLTRRDGSTEPA